MASPRHRARELKPSFHTRARLSTHPVKPRPDACRVELERRIPRNRPNLVGARVRTVGFQHLSACPSETTTLERTIPPNREPASATAACRSASLPCELSTSKTDMYGDGEVALPKRQRILMAVDEGDKSGQPGRAYRHPALCPPSPASFDATSSASRFDFTLFLASHTTVLCCVVGYLFADKVTSAMDRGRGIGSVNSEDTFCALAIILAHGMHIKGCNGYIS